jgi:N-acetylglucosaminyldiphosphoundecaprenol N-acetyl-beta-D-mannosaminyltransferase
VGGVCFHAITERECVTLLMSELDAGRGGWIVTVNVDHLRLFSRDPDYAALCAKASLVVADGMPIVWASRLSGTPLPERVAGSNLIWALTEQASTQEHSIFLLGGAPGTAEATAQVFRSSHPQLRIVGTLCPPTGFESDPDETAGIIEHVCRAQPDLVFVALGKPKQEILIDRIRVRLPEAWFVGVGISFSFVAGDVRRAPAWMQRHGMEWFHRMAQEPGRLAGRYLIHDLPVAAQLLFRAFLSRYRSSAGGTAP